MLRKLRLLLYHDASPTRAPGKRFRQRNLERIADEMAALYHERGSRQFVFHDDNFLVPSEAINHARTLLSG